jgi:hypothetical protein
VALRGGAARQVDEPEPDDPELELLDVELLDALLELSLEVDEPEEVDDDVLVSVVGFFEEE